MNPYSGGVVSGQWAIEVVRKYLATQAALEDDQALVVAALRKHRLGWLVFCQSERYVRTREFSDMLIGTGCFLVDGLDASLHHLPSAVNPDRGSWISKYLEEVRGVAGVDWLRPQITKLVRERGRLEAIRTVREAVPALDPVSADRYIDAVATNAPLPEDVQARIAQPPHVHRRHVTLTGPNPEPLP